MLRRMGDAPETLQEFCRQILERGDLTEKLNPPRPDLRDGPSQPVCIDAPVRNAALRLAGGADRLPRPGELSKPEARARCLARFAHHELQAVELFAWALLRWPALPAPLRRAWLGILADEQRHCRMYLERLQDHGQSLADYAPHSDYFWHQAANIAASPHGARAFLAAMGLTLEQANLDFTLTYRDAFRAAGDEPSARVCQTVHDEEIGHVRLAAEWLERLGPAGAHQVDLYTAAVPFPLSASRAKGRRFDAASRRRAGLSEPFIEWVRQAQSSQARPVVRNPR
jgi:uncharacterized ferritin-like protein (DUF455 family)